jgi:hypothetical protein
MSRPVRYCRVKTVKKRTSLTPCEGLKGVLSDPFKRGAGARIATFMRIHDSSITHQRLVISPPAKDGPGVIANFCPYCGEAISEIGDKIVAERKR